MVNTKSAQSRSFVEKVKNSIDIVSLIEKSVSLHRENDEWYAGATSASSHSGASLKVNSREGYYVNFATGDKGDAFNWIAFDQRLDIKKDFQKILAVAAEEAGIPYEAMSKEDQEKAEMTRAVQDTLTQAAEIYHNNLTPELRKYIHTKWGINDSTVDTLKIGYAKPENNLIGKFDFQLLKASGLMIKLSEGGYREHFQGRITFPYWDNGKVVNFAARGDKDNLKTPDTKYEEAKYKKLLVHSEKHDYVYESINNRYLFGADSIRNQTYCIITEGIADSIVLMQNGFPVLSPATTQFSERDHEKLVSTAKKLKYVYICNDNEESGAGEKGAIKTGKLLKRAGVEVKIVTLPRPAGVSKIDVAEFFLNSNKGDFETVLAASTPIYTYLLNKNTISQNKNENIESAKKFINEVVKFLPKDEADIIINYDVKNYFDISRDDCRTLKAYYTRIKEETKDESKEQASEDTFKIPFDVVADRILKKVNLFTFDDTKEIYIYKNGVYTKKGAEATIKDMANEIYAEVFTEYCSNEDLELPEHLPVPSINFRNEVLEYIRIKTNTFRESVDNCPEYKHLINLQNGIYNLDTGELMPHDPKYKLVRQMPIAYNKYTDCPQVRKFLSDVVSAQEAQVLLEFLGYSFIPDIKHDQAIMLLGNGANGKSVWLKVIIAIQGLENICSTSLQRLCEDKFAMSELYGKLLNIFPDLSDTMIQGDDAFKGLSSGDLLTAQQKYGQPFQFMNYARQIYSANDIPAVRKGNYAYFRRWMLINFPYTFVENPDASKNEKKKDKELLGKLTTAEELSGLFNLAIACLRELQRNGRYTYTDTVEEVAEKYQTSSDPIKVFIEKYTEPSEEDTSKPDMYEAYKNWCDWKKLTPLSVIKFAKRLKSMGFSECRYIDPASGKRELKWEGIELNEEYKAEAKREPEQRKVTDNYATETQEKEKMLWELYRTEVNLSESNNFPNVCQSFARVCNADFSTPAPCNEEVSARVYSIPVIHYEKLAQGVTDSNMVCADNTKVHRGYRLNSGTNPLNTPYPCVKTDEINSGKILEENQIYIKETVSTPEEMEAAFDKEKEEQQEQKEKENNDIRGKYSQAKEAILEVYHKRNAPIENIRTFVNDVVSKFPEFPRDMIMHITGIYQKQGKIAVYGEC